MESGGGKYDRRLYASITEEDIEILNRRSTIKYKGVSHFREVLDSLDGRLIVSLCVRYEDIPLLIPSVETEYIVWRMEIGK